MAANVPTMDEFNALERRVAALEGTPSEPPSNLPQVKAKRIADLIERFGVNTFSSLDENNVWGSWPADYRPQTVVSALKYITGTTKFCLRIREYHYRGREDIQDPWLTQIRTVYPDMLVAMCVGANGQVADVASILGIGGVTYVEGINEPNTDFGQGQMPFEQCKAIQDEVWMRTGSVGGQDKCMGPSIVAGMPHPEGWIQNYCGVDGLAALNKEMVYGNGHYYPPGCPDIDNSGTSITEYCDGLAEAYAGKPIMVTEFHPTLFNNEGHAPKQAGWSGERDAYYLMLSLFRVGKADIPGLWWYALFDYSDVYICGLFPRNQEDPRPAATAMRNLCLTCNDPGDDLRSFDPDSLQVSVSGPDNDPWDWDLYQGSDGVFYLPLWKAATDLGGASTEIELDLAKVPHQIAMIDLLTGSQLKLPGTPGQTKSFVIQLDASARMIVIRP